MTIRFHVCFAAGRALTVLESQFFGSEIAEPPIIFDYLELTEGSPLGEKERDWWDEGPLKDRIDNYLSILKRRHRLSEAKLKALRATPMPDILTYQGLELNQLRFSASRRVTSRLVGVPQFLRMGAKKGSRNEFYEIKPRSHSGFRLGDEKVGELLKIYPANGLPYKAGTLYPDFFYPNGIARIPLLARDKKHVDQWRHAVEIAKRREKLSHIEIYLEVSRKGLDSTRPMPEGLLLYRICVEIHSEDDKTNEKVVRIARDLVHAWTVCATAEKPDEVRTAVREAFLSFKPAAIARGDELGTFLPDSFTLPSARFPLIDVAYKEILPKLAPTLKAVREAMISQGVGLPGEEYLVCCDEVFFATLAADAAPLINMIQMITQTPIRWYGYVKDRGSLGVLDMVVEANEFLFQAKELALDSFTDLKRWAHENPGKAAVLAVVVVIVSAAIIYFLAPLVAAELGLTVTAAEVATETTGATGIRVAVTEATPGQLLRVGMQQEIMQDALLEEAAEAVVERQALQQSVRATVQANAVPRGVQAAAAARQAFLAQAGTSLGRQTAATFLDKAGPLLVAGGIGLTIAGTGRIAYAQTKGAVAATPEGAPIGLQVGRMFLLKADEAPPPPPALLAAIAPPLPEKPQIGHQFDAARFSKEAADSLKSGGPTSVNCHYLGRLRVS